jgi:hypothetical protein
MAASSTLQKAGRFTVSGDFERWKDDLLLRESLVSESETTKRNRAGVSLSLDGRRCLQKGFGLSPEQFRCLENVVLGRPCVRCPRNHADVLADRALLHVNVDPQGRRSCTPTEITAFVYETVVMLLEAISRERDSRGS